MSSVKKGEIFIFKMTDVWSYVKETSMLKICALEFLQFKINQKNSISLYQKKKEKKPMLLIIIANQLSDYAD